MGTSHSLRVLSSEAEARKRESEEKARSEVCLRRSALREVEMACARHISMAMFEGKNSLILVSRERE